jgi:hypothetical protein
MNTVDDGVAAAAVRSAAKQQGSQHVLVLISCNNFTVLQPINLEAIMTRKTGDLHCVCMHDTWQEVWKECAGVQKQLVAATAR